MNKQKIIFTMSIFFFITTVLTNVYNTGLILKENKTKKEKLIKDNSSKHSFQIKTSKNLEKIKYILEISDTLGEAINYIEQNFQEDNNEQVIIVARDSVDGLESIKNNLGAISSEKEYKKIVLETSNLESLFNDMNKLLNQPGNKDTEKIISSKIVTAYFQWKNDIENVFKRYTVP